MMGHGGGRNFSEGNKKSLRAQGSKQKGAAVSDVGKVYSGHSPPPIHWRSPLYFMVPTSEVDVEVDLHTRTGSNK